MEIGTLAINDVIIIHAGVSRTSSPVIYSTHPLR